MNECVECLYYGAPRGPDCPCNDCGWTLKNFKKDTRSGS